MNNYIPESAIWKGPPNKERIHVIQSLTYTDDKGRRYYRTSPNGPLRKMWEGNRCYNESRIHFDALNLAIDHWSPRERGGK